MTAMQSQQASAAQPHLFGFDDTPGIVAVEVVENDARLLRAEGDRRMWESRPFRPWLVTGEDGRFGARFAANPAVEWRRLEGSGLDWQAFLPGWSAFLDAREEL